MDRRHIRFLLSVTSGLGALGGCGAFDYRERRDTDASVEPAADPDGGGLAGHDLDAGLDAARDAGTVRADAAGSGPPSDGGVLHLGLASGCSGQPFDHYTFVDGTEGWRPEEPPPTPAAPTLVHDGAEGSLAPGSLRWTIPFTAVNQTVKLRVQLSQPTAVRCISARLKIAPGGLDQYLARSPGAWSFDAVSSTGCFGQVVTEDGSGFRKDLSADSVWYELAFDLARFEQDDRCPLNASAITSFAITVASALNTPSVRPATIYVDDVRLYR